MIEKYYIREDKKYYKCLQGVSNNKIIPNKVGNTSKNIFFGLSLCSLVAGVLLFILHIIINMNTIRVNEAVRLLICFFISLVLALVFIYIACKSHEHTHKSVMEQFGGKFEILGNICIETTGIKFTRNQYIKGLLTPLVIVLISGIPVFILLCIVTNGLVPLVFLSGVFWGLKISRFDIHDTMVLLKNHSTESQVEMIAEKTQDKVYSGFKVYE